jgi:dihydrodiol dehydrogenase / D-xylose 1-dehydrogenase (NADP)
MAVTRWGIFGAGLISNDFVLALKTLPPSEHQVVAVGNRSLESAKRFATKHEIPRHYGSLDQFLQDKEIDVVYIGTVNTSHLQIALKVLDAGKPVLCEKPMTMSPTDTQVLIDKAKEKGLLLIEGTTTSFFPAYVELRRMIADGQVGDPKFVRVNFSYRLPSGSAKGRQTDPALGGGSILDLGVYAISFATMIFGESPLEIHARGTLLDTGVDDLAVITLTYGGGRIAQLSCGNSYSMACEAIVCGTKGELQLPHPFWCSTRLETPSVAYFGPSISMDFPLAELSEATNYPNGAGLRYEAEEVRHCLNSGLIQSPVMSWDQSMIVAEIANEAMKQIGVVYCK